MNRRKFLKYTGLAAGSLFVPVWGQPVAAFGETAPAPAAEKKKLADAALNAATKKGATYADVRIGRYLNQFIITREDKVENIVNTESYGAGVRVIADGCWGFSATDQLTPESIARAAEEAVAIAKANAAAKIQEHPVELAPQKGLGEVSWRTPIERNAFEVPLTEKVGPAHGRQRRRHQERGELHQLQPVPGQRAEIFRQHRRQLHRPGRAPHLAGVQRHRHRPQVGQVPDPQRAERPCGRGYEYLAGRAEGKRVLPGIATRYTQSYDMVEDAGVRRPAGASEKVAAKSVEAGQYDLVLDPSHLWLTIHESIGHATELDRVLGYEANYAGTSFATLDKWKSGNFKYGSPHVNIVADKTQPGSLGAVGYDDEGVPCRQVGPHQGRHPRQLPEDPRPGAHRRPEVQRRLLLLGQLERRAVPAHAQRLAPARQGPEAAAAEMIKGVERGIYIVGDGSFSIDQQRYNFQFGGQLFYEIKDGKIDGMLRDVAYQSNTQEFWNSCVAVCDEHRLRAGRIVLRRQGPARARSAPSRTVLPRRVSTR